MDTLVWCSLCYSCREIFEVNALSQKLLKLFMQGHPRSAEVPHVADFKSAYISLIIGPRGLQCETNL